MKHSGCLKPLPIISILLTFSASIHSARNPTSKTPNSWTTQWAPSDYSTDPAHGKLKDILVSREVFETYNAAAKFCTDIDAKLYKLSKIQQNSVGQINGLADYLGDHGFSNRAVVDKEIVRTQTVSEICLVVRESRWYHTVYSKLFSVSKIVACEIIKAHAVCERDPNTQNSGKTIDSRVHSVHENDGTCAPGCVGSDTCVSSVVDCIPDEINPSEGSCLCAADCYPNCELLFVKPCDTDLCKTPTSNFTYPNNCYYDGKNNSQVGDAIHRDLPTYYLIADGHLSSIDWCRMQCGNTGHQYAGVQSHSACMCGNTFGYQGRANDTDCSRECLDITGGANMCGGAWRNNIYESIIPAQSHSEPETLSLIAFVFQSFIFSCCCCGCCCGKCFELRECWFCQPDCGADPVTAAPVAVAEESAPVVQAQLPMMPPTMPPMMPPMMPPTMPPMPPMMPMAPPMQQAPAMNINISNNNTNTN